MMNRNLLHRTWFSVGAAVVLCLAFSIFGAQSAVAQKNAGAAAAVPGSSDGHPDLSGLWNGGANMAERPDPNNIKGELKARGASVVNFERDNTLLRRMNQNKPVYKPQYWEIIQHLDQNGSGSDPEYNCMPDGVPRMGPPIKIVQLPKEMIFFYQNPDTYRIIPTNGRPHTPDDQLEGTWKGEPRGHWEDEVFVIDSTGFNASSWLGIAGWIHGDNMRVVERLTRQGESLKWQATVDDPDYFVKPWTTDPVVRKLNNNPDVDLEESLPCSERDVSHLVTKEHH
jgi:hypothetical protein